MYDLNDHMEKFFCDFLLFVFDEYKRFSFIFHVPSLAQVNLKTMLLSVIHVLTDTADCIKLAVSYSEIHNSFPLSATLSQ